MMAHNYTRTRFRGAGIWIPMAIGLVTLFGLSLATDGDILGVLRGTDMAWVALAGLKAPALLLLWTVRWHLVLRSRRFPVRFGQTLSATLVRIFFNNLTPGFGTGGEPAAAYYLSKRSPIPLREAMASTAAERMAQGVCLVLIILLAAAVSLPLLPLSSALARALIIGLAAFAVLVGLLLYVSVFRFRCLMRLLLALVRGVVRLVPSLADRLGGDGTEASIDGFHHGYRLFLRNGRAILGIFLATAVHLGLDILQHYALLRALHVDVPLWVILVAATVVKIAGIFAVIPGGAGMIEALNFSIYAGLSSLPDPIILSETVLYRALDAWILWIVSAVATAFLVGRPGSPSIGMIPASSR